MHMDRVMQLILEHIRKSSVCSLDSSVTYQIYRFKASQPCAVDLCVYTTLNQAAMGTSVQQLLIVVPMPQVLTLLL